MKHQIKWTPDNVQRLREILVQSPTLQLPSVAAIMGVSVSSVKTAISRHGMSKPAAQMTQRPCLCRRRPFLAEHRANYICAACSKEISEVAA
jgi:hypothetical protein